MASGPGYVHCEDGPAAGIHFYVQRGPMFLRFVCSDKGKWDVLDLYEDDPHPNEEVFVYYQDRWIHVRANDRTLSGVHYYYTHVDITQEEKATLRYSNRWREWATLRGTEKEIL